jgi:hypothetical protein
MKCPFPFFILIASLVALSVAPAQGAPHFGGFLRQESSILLEDGEYALTRNTLDLDLSQSWSDFGFRIDPSAYQSPGEEIELGLRQAYIDLYWSSVDLRIGRQQIVWGKADGMFITDVVSPKDLRQFLLADFEEIRAGVDAIKLNLYRGDATLELAWLPVFTPTRMPDSGSLWDPGLRFPVQPEFDLSRREVEGSLAGSELFGKISLLSSRVDFELMAGHTWDDDPALHADAVIDSDTQVMSSLTISPEHHRLTLVGGSFGMEVGGTILRGEGAYYRSKVFGADIPTTDDGTLARDYIHYLVGLDHPLFGLDLSAQFSQEVILDHDERLLRSPTREVITFLLREDLLGETLHLELFSYLGLEDGDALLRPKLRYDLRDGLELTLGGDIFIGDEGMFGTFDRNDLLYAKVKASF